MKKELPEDLIKGIRLGKYPKKQVHVQGSVSSNQQARTHAKERLALTAQKAELDAGGAGTVERTVTECYGKVRVNLFFRIKRISGDWNHTSIASISNDEREKKALEHEQTKLFIMKHRFMLHENQDLDSYYINDSWNGLPANTHSQEEQRTNSQSRVRSYF